MGEDSLLERITAATEERQFSQNTLTAYRRTWIKAIAWAAAEVVTSHALRGNGDHVKSGNGEKGSA
jgi:site-specific recombinase XerC